MRAVDGSAKRLQQVDDLAPLDIVIQRVLEQQPEGRADETQRGERNPCSAYSELGWDGGIGSAPYLVRLPAIQHPVQPVFSRRSDGFVLQRVSA